jgi:hypothetical protein
MIWLRQTPFQLKKPYIEAGPERKGVKAMQRKTPSESARKLGKRGDGESFLSGAQGSAFRRETFTLPREAARTKAREWFDRFPKAAYATEIEFWRELSDGRIEFTIRRLPSAD